MDGAIKNEETVSGGGGGSLILIAAVFAVVIVIGAAVYFSLQKAAVSAENDKLDAEIESLKGEIALLDEQKVEAARTAQQFLAELEKDEIFWSRVISRIQSLVPYDGTTQEAKVNFLSYNGTGGGKLNINAQSRNTANDPLDDVAEVIAVFNDSSYFENAIVPAVSVGENDRGEKSASFSIDMQYNESTPEEIINATEEETDGGVSRQ